MHKVRLLTKVFIMVAALEWNNIRFHPNLWLSIFNGTPTVAPTVSSNHYGYEPIGSTFASNISGI